MFGFFVVFAATLNFGYFIGDLTDPNVHNIYELYAAVIVNVIANDGESNWYEGAQLLIAYAIAAIAFFFHD